jgi:hypothetical protein
MRKHTLLLKLHVFCPVQRVQLSRVLGQFRRQNGARLGVDRLKHIGVVLHIPVNMGRVNLIVLHVGLDLTGSFLLFNLFTIDLFSGFGFFFFDFLFFLSNPVVLITVVHRL